MRARLAAAALLLLAGAAHAEDKCAAQNKQVVEALKGLGATSIEISGGSDCSTAADEAKKARGVELPGIDLANPKVPGNADALEDYNAGNLAIWIHGDYEKAAQAYYRGAMKGDPGCALQLASMYRYGQGVKENRAQAAAWVKVSLRNPRMLTEGSLRHNFLTILDLANQGYPDAEYAAGKAYAEYADGYEPTGNRERALSWLQQAAAGGVKAADALYKEMTRPVGPDPWEVALKHWQESAQASMNASMNQAVRTAQRQNRENCEAWSQGRNRPCYIP